MDNSLVSCFLDHGVVVMEIESVARLTFLRKSMWAERSVSGIAENRWAGAERWAGVRGAGAERRAGVTKIGLSGEREIGRSCSAHAPLTCSEPHSSYVNRANFSQASRGFVSDSWAFLLSTGELLICLTATTQHRTDYKITCVLLSSLLWSVFIQFWRNFAQRLGVQKARILSLGVKIWWPLPPCFAPIVQSFLHFQWHCPVDRLWGSWLTQYTVVDAICAKLNKKAMLSQGNWAMPQLFFSV